MMNLHSLLRMIVCCLLLTGCTKMCGSAHQKMSPEQVVEAYLDTAFNMTEVKQKFYLLQYTTGNLRHAIDTATDEAITTAYIKRKFKITQYAVVERRDRRPREVEIVFQLSFKDLGTDDELSAEEDAPTTTTENTVSVVKKHDLWLLNDVLGKKTSIDFPLSSAIEIKASAEDGVSELPVEDDEEEMIDDEDDEEPEE